MITLIELTRQRPRWELDCSCHPLGVSWWGGDLWTSHHPFLAPDTSWFLPWKPHVCWNSFSIALSGIRRVPEGADVAQTKRDMDLKSSSSQPRHSRAGGGDARADLCQEELHDDAIGCLQSSWPSSQ